MKKRLIIITVLLFGTQMKSQNTDLSLKFEDAIPVLNLGTFHMGYTPDANTTEFDEHNKKNVAEIHKIARTIAAFEPTVIIVETSPSQNEELQESYYAYLEDPQKKFENPSEIQLLAYEVGRLANSKRIYGIDFKEGYNYRVASQIENSKDSDTYFRYMKMLDNLKEEYTKDDMTVLQHLQMTNDPRYQDILMNINADMLTHIASTGNSEGADEAAKFYHRNLVMYSNLNKIHLKEDDRVFILMGGTHTAFFNMWLNRSPKYKLNELNEYLKYEE